MYPGFLVQIEQSNLENADKKTNLFGLVDTVD